jgi:hypothetical protein
VTNSAPIDDAAALTRHIETRYHARLFPLIRKGSGAAG